MALGDGIRRNIAHVDPSERAALREAFLELNRIPFRGVRTDTPPGGVTWWFKQDEMHHATRVHGGPDFLPWHRELVNRLEAMLRQINPQLSLHYWDWTQDPRSIPDANLGRGTKGTLNLFTETFMGYGGPTRQVIGPPWQSANPPWKRDGYYVPDADPHRDTFHNPADPPREVIRSVAGSPAKVADDALILAAENYPTMRQRLEDVHNAMHSFVQMGGADLSFRDPFVFLLHSNGDRLFARWQTDPAHPERLDPRLVYGSESESRELSGNIPPWSGVPPTTRPWAPPENEQVAKTYKDPSVVTPPLYDTNFATRPRAADGWVTSWGPNRVDIFAIGIDSAMYHKSLEGSTWRPSVLDWERLGGNFSGPPAVTAWRNSQLDVFGRGNDGVIYHKAWDGSAWRPSPLDWERLGNNFASPPAVTAWSNNRLDVFVVGSDSAIYHKTWDGSTWRADWERLGGTFTSPPAVTAWDNNRLDIFAVGIDSKMYHKAWDGSAWRPSPTEWNSLEGTFISPPSVTAWANNRLDIFAIGIDSVMYHKAWVGSGWRPDWDRLGGIFISPPAVTAWGNNRLDIFAIGVDSAVYHKAWDGLDWRPSPSDWERLGGTFTSPPAVTAWGNNRLDIFAVGVDSAMYHKAWDGSTWRPSLLGWDRLGGTFIAP